MRMLLLAAGLEAILAIGTLAEPAASQDEPLVDVLLEQQLNPVEVARIGGDDNREPYALSFVPAATLLPCDEIALIDGLSDEVRVFGTDGVFRRRFGRSGQGPGEFGAPIGIAFASNQLLVWDAGGESGPRRRIVTFSLDGTHLQTHQYSPPAVETIMLDFFGNQVPAPAWIVQSNGGFVGAVDASTVVLLESRPPRPTPGTRTDSIRVVAYSLAERTSSVLGMVPDAEVTYENVAGIGTAQRRVFYREPMVAAVAGRVVFASTEDSTLEAMSLECEPPVSIRLRARRRQATSADLQRAVEEQLEAFEVEQARRPPESMPQDLLDALRDRASRLHNPYGTLPEFRSLKAGSDGALWVEDFPRPGAAVVRWYRFEDQRVTGWMDVPNGTRVLAFGFDYMAHLELDAFDLQTVVVSRIQE